MAFLIEAGVDANAGTCADTPLTAAAREGTVEAVRWLLEHGAKVNGRAEPTASTPLEQPVVEGRLEIVINLLERGADPDILHGNPQRNVLASARFWGHEEIAAFLEGRGSPRSSSSVIRSMSNLPLSSPRDTRLAVGQWFDQKWLRVRIRDRARLELAVREEPDSLPRRLLIDQLANGGTSFVYINPSAEYASEIVEAPERIGASRAADVMRTINAMFPDGSPSKDHGIRINQLKFLS